MFKRGGKITVAINPSSRNFEIDAPLGKIRFSQNAEIVGNKLKMKGASFIVVEE